MTIVFLTNSVYPPDEFEEGDGQPEKRAVFGVDRGRSEGIRGASPIIIGPLLFADSSQGFVACSKFHMQLVPWKRNCRCPLH